ncbi:hypothetical protein PRJ_Fausto_00216 [Faustovirus]|nr:hypothetical protein PRJ_Fausto_00216 [Faustovirus]QBR99123.1 hypothetical protein [Faustovirus mariensis]
MTQYCEYCQQYTRWVTDCPTYRAHVQSCRTARMVATRDYQEIINAKDKRIRELEEQLKTSSTTQLKVPNAPPVENKSNITNNNIKNKSNQENDFAIKYDRKSKQYTGVIDSDDIKVEFTHKGHSNINSILTKVIDLISGLTI